LANETKTTHPGNALVDVGGGVGETLDLTGLSSEKAVEVRSDLVRLAGTEGVALSASGLLNVSIMPQEEGFRMPACGVVKIGVRTRHRAPGGDGDDNDSPRVCGMGTREWDIP
jgi:hypothetical protein